jgi:hypothetical protein
VQRLGQIAASGAGWQGPFIAQLAGVYLLIRAFEGIDALPEAVRDDVLANIGIPLRPEEVAALPPTHDIWQVIAQELEVEEKLRVLRTWLFGCQSKRPALVLAFAHGNAALDTSLAAGTCFEGDVCFYPGNGLRAALKSRGDLQPLDRLRGLANLNELCDLAATRFSREPWLAELAAPLHGITPMKSGEQWLMLDAENCAIPATLGDPAAWLAMAMAGGKPVDLMAGYDGRKIRPLAMIADGEYVSLTGPK